MQHLLQHFVLVKNFLSALINLLKNIDEKFRRHEKGINNILRIYFIASNSFDQKNIPGKQEVDYVNTLIGTAATGFANGLDGGRTMPCVGLRFVMTNFVAQTGESKMSRMNYFYEDSSVNGFFASQQPTAVNQNEDQSFIIHRCVSKIVRIYREDFKKKKSNVL